MQISYLGDQSQLKKLCENAQRNVTESTREALEREKNGEVNWIAAVTCNTDALPEGGNIPEPIQPLAVDNIRAAQNADLAMSRVSVLKRTHAYLNRKHKQAENEAVRHLIWDRWRRDPKERNSNQNTAGCNWVPEAYRLQTPKQGDGTLRCRANGGSCQGMVFLVQDETGNGALCYTGVSLCEKEKNLTE